VAAKRYEAAIPGLNGLLRDIGKLPKEAQGELRTASRDIADRHMVPAWKAAALRAGPWGSRIAASVRAGRDRVPKVIIGSTRRAFSGGASPTMVRYATHAGRQVDPVFPRTDWMTHVKPAYIGAAVGEWGAAVSKVCRDFNHGRDY
jgi:hypothetical protein